MTPEHARRVMRGNRSKDTKPELALRRELHRRGLRYFANRRIVVDGFACRPDVVFPRRRVAVFMDGCFWHACPEHYSPPRTNVDFWIAKIDRNLLRDQRTDYALEEAGWAVVRVWEHEHVPFAADQVERAVRWQPGGDPSGRSWHECCTPHPSSAEASENADEGDVMWVRPMVEVVEDDVIDVIQWLGTQVRRGSVCDSCLVSWGDEARTCWSCGGRPYARKGRRQAVTLHDLPAAEAAYADPTSRMLPDAVPF